MMESYRSTPLERIDSGASFKFLNARKTDPGEIVNDCEVTATDVLNGKGKGVAQRDGNIFYSRLIKANLDEYQAQKVTKLKKEIARRVVDIIKAQEPEGRFLKSATGAKHSLVWIIQDDKFAMKKVTQALREKRFYTKSAKKQPVVTNNVESEDRNDTSKKRSSILRSFRRVRARSWKNI